MSGKGKVRSGQVMIRSSLDVVKSGQFKSYQITFRSSLVKSVQVMSPNKVRLRQDKLGNVMSGQVMSGEVR